MTDKRYEVLLTAGAERDLESIYDHITEFDSAAKAQQLLDRLTAVAESLSKSPQRGSHPQELLALGIRDYRQVFFKPYRIIYRLLLQQVHVYMIVDGRRDMQSLLERRILRG